MHLAGLAYAGTRCFVGHKIRFSCCSQRGLVATGRHSVKTRAQISSSSSSSSSSSFSTEMVTAGKVQMEVLIIHCKLCICCILCTPHQQPALMQITRANFQQSLPVIKQALQDCQFFAFDCEMTGLDVQESTQEYLDEIEDRYHTVTPVSCRIIISIPGRTHWFTANNWQCRLLQRMSFGQSVGMSCRRRLAAPSLRSHKSVCLLLFGQRPSISTDLAPSTSMCSQSQSMATIDDFCLRYALFGSCSYWQHHLQGCAGGGRGGGNK